MHYNILDRSSNTIREINPDTGEEEDYVLILSDAWRERFANSEQVHVLINCIV